LQTLIIAALIFALLIAIFASQNAELVEIEFIFWQKETPLVVVVLIAAILGALIIGLPGWIKQFRQSYVVRSLRQKINRLEKEKEELSFLIDHSRPANRVSEKEPEEGEENHNDPLG